jgi:hypothetical protein
MNIEKLKNLTDDAHEIEGIINKLINLKGDEYLNIKINVSNFYDFKELDTIQTDKNKRLEDCFIEYYQKELDKIKDEIKELVKED